MRNRHTLFLAAISLLLFRAPCWSRNFQISSNQMPWQQVDTKPDFRMIVEREEYSNLDRIGRMVFSVQGAKQWKLDELSVHWQVKQGDELIAENTSPIAQGLLDVGFTFADLKPGRYDVGSELVAGGKTLATAKSFFTLRDVKAPPQSGRIPIIFPSGVPLKSDSYPIDTGVPFPKGALWSEYNVRLVKADGTPVPAHFEVRSRWGFREETSIRWLGVDFQAEPGAAYWPQRKGAPYYLEYGPNIKPAAATSQMTVNQTDDGMEVNTGPLQFKVRRNGFNLLDDVRLNGKTVLTATAQDGLYLVDNEGSIYRAANDTQVKLRIEENSPLRVVICAEGWYVKDGTDGAIQNYALPTDKLCKFITRIEAYAGKPYVRVLSTWVNTYDTFTVRMRDIGITLPLQNASAAQFGIEGESRSRPAVPADGVRLVQHLPDQFVIEDGSGKSMRTGKHSAGWVVAETPAVHLGISNRDTWQRFPKEIEVLPNALKLHVWPAHGRDHPDINPLARDQIHRLWFAHQGKEMDMHMPWEYYLHVAKFEGKADVSISRAGGIAMMGVHSSGMGAATTSDFLLQFSEPAQDARAQEVASAFQATPHALADPKWTCSTLALGYVHQYDPENFADLEAIIDACERGYWQTQNATGEYGMWLYRTWHHNQYYGNGTWNLYRLYNASHHYDAFMPWMLYARSGNPFYLTQGLANIRMLSDVQIVHHDDRRYPHREFETGMQRVVGSMKHDNSFTPWGGDHAVLGHNTCYNALITAYYLTGDLRLRQILVDEWQNTLLTKRDDPEMYRADESNDPRSVAARNPDNAIGELIDMYQMTYNPGLLARMAPPLSTYTENMWDWGQALHNILLFRGDQEYKQILLKVAADFRAIGLDTMHRERGARPPDPHHAFSSLGVAEGFALSSIIAPDKGYNVEAYIAANPIRRQRWAEQYLKLDELHPVYCTIADYVNHLPHVMYAMAQAGARGGQYTWRELDKMQPLPLAGTGEPVRSWQHVIVREDKDQEIVLKLVGMIGKGGMPLQVFGPDKKMLMEKLVPTGTYSPYRVTIPKDGKTGEYSIFMRARDEKVSDDLRAPLTNLPEVYYTKGWNFIDDWYPSRPISYFTRSSGQTPETMLIHPHGPGRVLSHDGKQVLAEGEMKDLKVEAGPAGLWIESKAVYNWTPGKPLLLSVNPEQWFLPSDDQLNLQHAPTEQAQ